MCFYDVTGDSDAVTSVNKTIRTYASVPNLIENEDFGPVDTSFFFFNIYLKIINIFLQKKTISGEVGTQTVYDSGYSSQSSISSLV